MKRTDIEMTPVLKDFLDFDLGHMDISKYPTRHPDIEYAEGLKLDLYYPEEQKEKYPLVISIFGGGWVSGFKEDKYAELMLEPLKLGYAVAIPDYTLALDDIWPRQVIDLKQCIRFLKLNADRYHLHAEQITLWGESAGGHLALLAGMAENEKFGIAGDTEVQRIIAYYPLTDLDTVEAQSKLLGLKNDSCAGKDSMIAIMMGPHYHNGKERKAASPVSWISEKMPEVILVHGLADPLLPYLQSVEFFRRAAEMGVAEKVSLHLDAGKVHADSWFFSSEQVAALFRKGD
ncbi:MAG: alpha/beta hydrolase fold domain-containing protein [Bulleidia sp.]